MHELVNEVGGGGWRHVLQISGEFQEVHHLKVEFDSKEVLSCSRILILILNLEANHHYLTILRIL